MGEIVNLNRARKAKARTEAVKRAATNRVAFGRTKAEKTTDRAESAQRERTLDGAKREE